MRCDYCGHDIMKADYYCSFCATPNPQHDLGKLREAVLHVAAEMGMNVEALDGANGSYAWNAFCERMWPAKEPGNE